MKSSQEEIQVIRELTAHESYMAKSRSSGLMTEGNKAGFEAVAEMLKHPLSPEQAKEKQKKQWEDSN